MNVLNFSVDIKSTGNQRKSAALTFSHGPAVVCQLRTCKANCLNSAATEDSGQNKMIRLRHCAFRPRFSIMIWFEPRHDKTNKVSVRPAKTQISLGIRTVWSKSSLAWRNLGPLTTHWAHSEDFDQTVRMPRLIWVFAGRTLILLVLSCRGSFDVRFIIYNAANVDEVEARVPRFQFVYSCLPSFNMFHNNN